MVGLSTLGLIQLSRSGVKVRGQFTRSEQEVCVLTSSSLHGMADGRNPRQKPRPACVFELILPKQREESRCHWPSDTEILLPSAEQLGRNRALRSQARNTHVCLLLLRSLSRPFSLSLHCLSGTQKTLPATACCLQLLGLGGLTHLAPNRTEDRARGSGVTSPAPSVASYCPPPPRPQGSQPPGTSGCEFVWKVSADLSRTAQCWPSPNSKRFRSILKQGLSQCATRAALTCNLRSSASQVLGLQG